MLSCNCRTFVLSLWTSLFSEFLKDISSQASSSEITLEDIDLHENLYDAEIDIEALIEVGKSRERYLDEAINSLQTGDFWRCDSDSAQQASTSNVQTSPDSHHQGIPSTITASCSCNASRASTSHASSAS